jgi:hypothetical protein
MGLGMGWIAINAALKPTVSHVTVVELDPEVIELFSLSGASDAVPEAAKNKITIVNANALEWTSNVKVDFLYADIWLSLDEPETLEQVRRMNKNLKAATVYFWGQEIAIYAGIERQQGENVSINAASIKQCLAEDIGLPLLVPSDINYAGLIECVAKNRKERNLSMGRMLRDLKNTKMPFIMSSNFKTGDNEDEDIDTDSERRILTDGGLGCSFG